MFFDWLCNFFYSPCLWVLPFADAFQCVYPRVAVKHWQSRFCLCSLHASFAFETVHVVLKWPVKLARPAKN